MNININAIKFKATEKLEAFVFDKVSKLERSYDGILTADVTLKVDKPESDENKIVEIQVSIPGNNSFASKFADTFEEATLLCVDALKVQLQKQKRKPERAKE